MPTSSISLAPQQNAFIDEMLREGATALERGEYTEVEDEDLNSYLDSLAVPTSR